MDTIRIPADEDVCVNIVLLLGSVQVSSRDELWSNTAANLWDVEFFFICVSL